MVDAQSPSEAAPTIDELLKGVGTAIFPVFYVGDVGFSTDPTRVDCHPALCGCPTSEHMCKHKARSLVGFELLISLGEGFPAERGVDPLGYLNFVRTELKDDDSSFASFENALIRRHISNFRHEHCLWSLCVENKERVILVNIQAPSVYHLGRAKTGAQVGERTDLAVLARWITEESGLDNSQVVLEITEGHKLEDDQMANEVGDQMLKLPFRYVCDDQSSQGTSDSRMLRILPFGVKIDQAIIRTFLNHDRYMAFVGTDSLPEFDRTSSSDREAIRSLLAARLIQNYAYFVGHLQLGPMFIVEGFEGQQVQAIFRQRFPSTSNTTVVNPTKVHQYDHLILHFIYAVDLAQGWFFCRPMEIKRFSRYMQCELEN